MAAVSSLALPAQALIYYSNYIPSNVPVTQQTGGQFPVERRLPDASQSFDTFGIINEYQIGFICCTFGTRRVTTEFVSPTSFTAAALVVPIMYVSAVGARNLAFTVQRLDGSTWVNARTDSFARVPNLSAGVINEIEMPFGTNATNLPEHFAYRPITFNAGDTYRIITSTNGAIGRTNWYLSDTEATPGQSRQSQTGQPVANLAFQPAFALTDGGALTFPVIPPPEPPYVPPVISGVPEPSSWAMLIAGFGLIGAVARRRRVARFA